MYNWHK